MVAKTTAPSCATLHFKSFDQTQEAQAFKSLWALARIIRSRVFVEEEGIAEELEFDVHDESCHHVLGFLGDAPVLCARWRVEHPNGWENRELLSTKMGSTAGPMAVIDRLAVLKPYRGRGFAAEVLKFLGEDAASVLQGTHLGKEVLRAIAVLIPVDLTPCLSDKLREQGGFHVMGNPFMDARNKAMLRMVRQA